MASYSNVHPRTAAQNVAHRNAMDMEVTKLLETDHARLAMLFSEFERMASRGNLLAKKELSSQIFLELTVHMQIMEEVLHPVTYKALRDDHATRRALAQHAFVRCLIEQLEAMSPTDDCYDIKIMALGDYALKDVEVGESALMPQIRKANIDLEGIGAALASRRNELMSMIRL